MISAVWEVEEQSRDRGMKRAAVAHHTDLRLAREVAHELAQDGRVISASDVREVLLQRHPDIEPGNWLGALFSGDEWVPAGFVKSRVKGSHLRRLVAWRLR